MRLGRKGTGGMAQGMALSSRDLGQTAHRLVASLAPMIGTSTIGVTDRKTRRGRNIARADREMSHVAIHIAEEMLRAGDDDQNLSSCKVDHAHCRVLALPAWSLPVRAGITSALAWCAPVCAHTSSAI